jgi:hypothetical protein
MSREIERHILGSCLSDGHTYLSDIQARYNSFFSLEASMSACKLLYLNDCQGLSWVSENETQCARLHAKNDTTVLE